MKLALMRRALAASLLLAPAAYAAGDAAKPTPAPQPVMLRAFLAAMHEMRQVIDEDAHPNANFEKLLNFQHSPETVALLVEAFGTERPWTLEKRGTEQGKTHWYSPVYALQTTTSTGGTLAWSELPASVWVDQAGKTIDMRATWASLTYEDKDMAAAMRDARLSYSLRRGGGKLWYGGLQGGIDSIRIDGKSRPFSMAMRDIRVSSTMEERPRTVEMKQHFGIKAIEVAGERIDDFRFVMRLANVEKAALVALQAADKKLRTKEASDLEQLNAIMPLFKSFVGSAAKHKTALVVDDISFAFHGHKAQLRGRVALDGAAGTGKAGLAALDGKEDAAALAKRIHASFQLKVPVAMVREVAQAFVRQQAAAASAQGKTADAPADAGAIADAIIGKLVSNGFARVENGMLLSTLEFRHGVLRINGKKIDMPKPARTPAPTAPASFLQARRIPDSCTLPDYPAAVVEADAPLLLPLEYVVDASGKVSGVKAIQGSGHADFDAAVVAAFAACRFVPALQDGKPAEQAQTWAIEREPGSKRP